MDSVNSIGSNTNSGNKGFKPTSTHPQNRMQAERDLEQAKASGNATAIKQAEDTLAGMNHVFGAEEISDLQKEGEGNSHSKKSDHAKSSHKEEHTSK